VVDLITEFAIIYIKQGETEMTPTNENYYQVGKTS